MADHNMKIPNQPIPDKIKPIVKFLFEVNA